MAPLRGYIVPLVASLFVFSVLPMLSCGSEETVEGALPSDCADGLDNDGDGAVDCADPGCSGWDICQDDTSSGTEPQDTGPFQDTSPPEDTGIPNIPCDSDICLNEFMADNNSTMADPDLGAYSDWLELYNSGSEPVNLAGYSVTDDFSQPTRQVLPDVTMPPGSYLLLWADGRDDLNGVGKGLHLSFKLDRKGEELGLYDPDGVLLDAHEYDDQTIDLSEARVPDGDVWTICYHPSPGQPNSKCVPTGE